MGGWSDDFVAKNNYCAIRVHEEFNSESSFERQRRGRVESGDMAQWLRLHTTLTEVCPQHHLSSNSQLTLTPAPEDPKASSILHRHLNSLDYIHAHLRQTPPLLLLSPHTHSRTQLRKVTDVDL